MFSASHMSRKEAPLLRVGGWGWGWGVGKGGSCVCVCV